MASLVKAIDEMHGGYSLDALTNKTDDSYSGGSSKGNTVSLSRSAQSGNTVSLSDFADLFIPFGLYYQNDRAEYTFYKPQKAGTIDNKLYDYLLDAVSKNRSKPTRKHTGETDTKKTRKHT